MTARKGNQLVRVVSLFCHPRDIGDTFGQKKDCDVSILLCCVGDES